MLLFRRNSRIARLYSIAVDSQFRGHGLGEALVQATEQAAVNKGIRHIRLEVRHSNQASRRLFARLGYAEREQVPGYYPDEDGLRMQKNLTLDTPAHG